MLISGQFELPAAHQAVFVKTMTELKPKEHVAAWQLEHVPAARVIDGEVIAEDIEALAVAKTAALTVAACVQLNR